MDFNEKMVRVNGVLLSKFQNQTVCLLGRVNHVSISSVLSVEFG